MGASAGVGATRQAVNNVKPIQSGVPPQGGKGGVYQPMPGQVPPQGGKGGAQQPGQPPYLPTGLPPSQPYPGTQMPTQVPPQGGKGGVYQPMPGQVPPQGGKGGVYQPMPGQVPPQGGKTAAPGTVFNPNNPNNVPLPAQGGKTPLTPEQLDRIRPNIDTFSAPQVSPPQGGFPQQGFGQQLAPGQVAPTQAEIDRLRPMQTSYANPMSPQVMQSLGGMDRYPERITRNPERMEKRMERFNQRNQGQLPMPANMAPQQGLAGLRGRR